MVQLKKNRTSGSLAPGAEVTTSSHVAGVSSSWLGSCCSALAFGC